MLVLPPPLPSKVRAAAVDDAEGEAGSGRQASPRFDADSWGLSGVANGTPEWLLHPFIADKITLLRQTFNLHSIFALISGVNPIS